MQNQETEKYIHLSFHITVFTLFNIVLQDPGNPRPDLLIIDPKVKSSEMQFTTKGL